MLKGIGNAERCLSVAGKAQQYQKLMRCVAIAIVSVCYNCCQAVETLRDSKGCSEFMAAFVPIVLENVEGQYS